MAVTAERVGGVHLYVAVAMAFLLHDHEGCVQALRDRANPLSALLVGSDQEGGVDVGRHPLGDARGG